LKRHDTPNDVACELAKHAPRRLQNVLDPAVGAGALLLPMVSQLKKQGSKVYCVDSDAKAICQLERDLRPLVPSGVRYVNADFLSWSQTKGLPGFDCIVMNPPFAASKSQLRRMRLSHDMSDPGGKGRFMPLEAAFVCRAIDLLKDDGRLLAVLPCSIVMSLSTQWLRDLLLKAGAIRFVHELPPRSFPNVESRMYLFVFDKSARQRKIVLFNHDLAAPERLDLWLSKTNPIKRFDFGYHRAAENLHGLMSHERFGWQRLTELAVILRGDIASPLGPTLAVHTSDYANGFWRRSERHQKSTSRDPEHTIQRADLLVKRVGRNCHKTFGRPLSLQGMPCSDCVLIVRPRDFGISTRLLFSLQTLFELTWSKPLLERGTGASYVSHESLLEMSIPTRLDECFPKTYASFVAAQKGRSPYQSRRAVCYAARRIARVARV